MVLCNFDADKMNYTTIDDYEQRYYNVKVDEVSMNNGINYNKYWAIVFVLNTSGYRYNNEGKDSNTNVTHEV